VRTLRNYEHVKLGVDGAHTLSVALDPSAAGYTTYGQERALYSQLTQAIDRIPGVISSAVAGCGLMNHGCAYLNALVPGSDAKSPVVERNYVGTDYFSTTGMKIVRGRAFSIDDSVHAEMVAIVNRDFEKQLLRDQDAIGRTVRVGEGEPAVIIGVVNDARTDSIKTAPVPFVYLPIAQAGAWNISHVEVRTGGNPLRIAPAVREAILGINRAIPIGKTMTVEEEADRDLAREFLMARLGLVFSFLSLLIAVVGVYGLTSYEVSRRKTEFAIRMALGATRVSILQHVFGRSALLLGIGSAAGFLISAAFSRLVASLLYGVGPYDPEIYAVALLMILITSASAAFLPSWRAASADPVPSLHRE
jgi:predicted permease